MAATRQEKNIHPTQKTTALTGKLQSRHNYQHNTSTACFNNLKATKSFHFFSEGDWFRLLKFSSYHIEYLTHTPSIPTKKVVYDMIVFTKE